MTPAPLLRLENITKSYQGVKVFDPIDLSLGPGSRVLIRGSNGCGKSTFLRIVAGLTQPDEGGLIWKSHEHLTVSYLPQAIMGFGDLSLRLNRLLLGLIVGSGAPTKKTAVDAYFRDRSHMPLRTLSGGYRRLFALHQVCSTRSDIIILDEPLSQLDDQRLEEAIAVICEAFDNAKIVIASQPTSKALPAEFEKLWDKPLKF